MNSPHNIDRHPVSRTRYDAIEAGSSADPLQLRACHSCDHLIVRSSPGAAPTHDVYLIRDDARDVGCTVIVLQRGRPPAVYRSDEFYFPEPYDALAIALAAVSHHESEVEEQGEDRCT
jgi:hypothetical protein